MADVYFYRMDPSVQLPKYATPGSACFDLQYNPHINTTIKVWDKSNPYGEIVLGEDKSFFLPVGARALVPTGLKVSFVGGEKDNWSIRIYSRSGLSIKDGVHLINNVGIIDSDYPGEIFLSLVNDGFEDFLIKPGDRLAQGEIFCRPTPSDPKILETFEEPQAETREGGFGSTGV
jgi:dUTP pyrophosphatase